MSSAAKRSSAVGTAADQYEMDQSAEVELQKLQRQVGCTRGHDIRCRR